MDMASHVAFIYSFLFSTAEAIPASKSGHCTDMVLIYNGVLCLLQGPIISFLGDIKLTEISILCRVTMFQTSISIMRQ